MGIQGSGKGTQAKIISEKLEIPHISTGDLFRGCEGELKSKLDEYMNSGKLIPDDLVLEILNERISKDDCEKGFILDGFPRNLEQAKKLNDLLEVDRVFEIHISDGEVFNRLEGRRTCKNCNAGYNVRTAPKPKNENYCDFCEGELYKRDDDNEGAIKKRIEIYHNETEPVLDFYEDKVIKINGEQEIEKIAEDILEELE